jgi:hypothetical protein
MLPINSKHLFDILKERKIPVYQSIHLNDTIANLNLILKWNTTF